MSRRKNRRPPPTTDTRSPEQRLEAFVREPNADRAQRMWARILDGLDEKVEPAPWIAAARTLSERLIISENAFFYLAEMLSESVRFHATATDAELVRLMAAIDEVKRAHGLREDEEWHIDEGPEEWRALNEQFDKRMDEATSVFWRTSGNSDLADVFDNDRKDFDARFAQGHADIWGEDEHDDDS